MSNYLLEFDPERMLQMINTKYKEEMFKICSTCEKLCETEKMIHSKTISVCNKCIQTDLESVQPQRQIK